MSTPNQYPDPLTEAAKLATRRAVKVAGLATEAVIMTVHLRERQRRLQSTRWARTQRRIEAELRADFAAARGQWSPALNQSWIDGADLLATARAWRAAAPYTGKDPHADTAREACEKRLRNLHPHAMDRYDRLRHDGQHPVDAMTDAAPLFARRPDVRTGEPTAAASGTTDEAEAAADLMEKDGPNRSPGGVGQDVQKVRPPLTDINPYDGPYTLGVISRPASGSDARPAETESQVPSRSRMTGRHL